MSSNVVDPPPVRTPGTPAHAYIAIEGLIGAGKTTLTKRLAQLWNARTVLEEFEENPFLPKFYDDQDRFAFSVELSFLAQRYHQLKRVGERSLFESHTVADYSIGKSLVFASVTLPADEAQLFKDLYAIMYESLPRPDLLVYLHLPMERVHERIRTRGRSYEQRIRTEYLERLQETYLDQLRKNNAQRTLVIDLGHTDLLHDTGAFERVRRLLEAEHAPGLNVVSP